VRYGHDFTQSEITALAKYDVLELSRSASNNNANGITSNVISTVKTINPNTIIYTYLLGPETSTWEDSIDVSALGTIARYNNARGHSMGSLNGNHPALFLTDSNQNRLVNTYTSSADNEYYFLDFGNPTFQNYWSEAAATDILGKPWTTDGIFVDNVGALDNHMYGYNTKYDTNAKWAPAMNSFVEFITDRLRAQGQKIWTNRGMAWNTPDGPPAWKALDDSGHAPDGVMEEGAFVNSGSGFAPEWMWKNEVDILQETHHSSVVMLSNTDLAVGASSGGVSFYQTLYFALGSYLLGKNDVDHNSYFCFFTTSQGGNYEGTVQWYDEFDHIDLGPAMGNYQVSRVNGNNIYWREFQKGYVYVNPTAADVSGITLAGSSKVISHDTLYSNFASLPSVSTISLNSHNAAILFKSSAVS